MEDKMKLLFMLDKKDYELGQPAFIRPSVRGIIIRGGKVGMVHSLKYHYYKFPGGGIEPGETKINALIRETLEETGLIILPDSIREYGYVHRIQKGTKGEVFIQDNYYYLCDAEAQPARQQLDDYEAQERFTLEFISPGAAAAVNREADHGPADPVMIEREARVLELLMQDVHPDMQAGSFI